MSASEPALRRLSSFLGGDVDLIKTLDDCSSRSTELRRGTVTVPLHAGGEPLLIVRGWAARGRYGPKGAFRLVRLLLPGDLVMHPEGAPAVPLVALSPLAFAPLPSADRSPALARAYLRIAEQDEAYLLAHLDRVGWMGAEDRILSFLAEIRERLAAIGETFYGGFDSPLTQHVLGELVGLTSVHVNRVLRGIREAGGPHLAKGRVIFPRP